MPPLKRSRACDACHSIKIKCGLGSEDRDPPCTRCVRLGKECIVSPPRRQKDRVAELEAQVEALSRQLESQKLQAVVPTDTEEAVSINLANKTLDSKKRRLDESAVRETSPEIKVCNIDHVVAPAIQKAIFHKYVDEMIPKFGLVPLTGADDYDSLCGEKPLLLHAIIYAAGHGVLSPDVQDLAGKILMDLLVTAANSKVEKSIELVQAIQIAFLWYRFPRHHTNITPLVLNQLAANVATDIGIAGTQSSPTLGHSSTTLQADGADAGRTWLVCCLLSANTSILFRTTNSMRWGVHEDRILVMLEYWPDDQGSDRLLAQYVRAERLCEQIALQSEFSDFKDYMDLAEPAMRLITNGHRNLITDWKAHIPPHLGCPTLKFWEHAAMLYLHEHVLHTPTNKQSFAAPFTAERLSVTDIPAPTVTQEHISSILALRENAHALIDLFSTLNMSTVISLPPVLFASRVAYSQWISIKLYLATTAPGNSFGNFLNPESLKVDEYLQKVIQVHDKTYRIDPSWGTTKILGASLRLREWLWNYRAAQLHSTTDVNTQAALPQSDFDVDWNNLAVASDTFDAELEDFLADALADFNLPIPQS